MTLPQDDPIIETVRRVIKEFGERVQAERDATSTALGLAEQTTTAALLGQTTDELTRMVDAQQLALEWGIDASSAADNLR